MGEAMPVYCIELFWFFLFIIFFRPVRSTKVLCMYAFGITFPTRLLGVPEQGYESVENILCPCASTDF